ncbi:MAG: porin family protein [Candidatus Electrothrix sp. AR3]|nr:porin family protein [Candidatus Electrothrix sp. AR3]
MGRQFGNFRAEGELGVQKADLKANGLSDVRIDTAMFNGFYEIPVTNLSIPWLGSAQYNGLSIYGTAGIGTAKVEVFFDNDIDESETTFAYKAGLGVALDVAMNMTVDLGYEYLRTSDIELGHDHNLLRADDIKNSSFVAALRYTF